MSKSNKAYQAPTHAEIAACAQTIYEREGRPEGKAMQHWLQAEKQLIAQHKAEAGAASAKTAPTMPAPEKARATTPPAAAPWSPPTRQPLPRN